MVTSVVPPIEQSPDRAACASCPFRSDARLGYDADAMEALNAGGVPGCHAKVGLDAVFNHLPFAPPDETVCKGFLAWEDGRCGYAQPALTP